MDIYGTVSKTGFVCKSNDVVAQMGYDERKAYEAARRAEMAAQGITEASLSESPAKMTKRLLSKLG